MISSDFYCWSDLGSHGASFCVCDQLWVGKVPLPLFTEFSQMPGATVGTVASWALCCKVCLLPSGRAGPGQWQLSLRGETLNSNPITSSALYWPWQMRRAAQGSGNRLYLWMEKPQSYYRGTRQREEKSWDILIIRLSQIRGKLSEFFK